MTPEDWLNNRNPQRYAASAALAHDVGKQLLERLEWMILKPNIILDIGCGIGDVAKELTKHAAEVIAVDLSDAMLQYAKQTNDNIHWLCADAIKLPFQNNTIDLITANLFLPWCSNVPAFLAECHRVLRPEGLIVFTSLGPDTLKELNSVSLSLPYFIDMHNVGDELIHAGFRDPVLDVEQYTMTYRDEKKLFAELQDTGMIFEAVNSMDLQPNEGVFSLTFEVIHGHAWKNQDSLMHTADADGIVKIPLEHLFRNRNK